MKRYSENSLRKEYSSPVLEVTGDAENAKQP